MSDTQQSLSKIRDNYEKIRNNMDINDLNDIISDSSDELFAGLKEIVFSKKSQINIQNDIRRIARSLEDKHKRLKKDDNKYIQEIADLTTDTTEKTKEKTDKETEVTTNKTEVTRIDNDIKNKVANKLKKESEKTQKDADIKKKSLELRQKKDEIINKTTQMNNTENKIKNKKNEINNMENKIKGKENEINNIENKIRNKEKDVNTIENKIKSKENERSTIENKIKSKENERSAIENKIKNKENEKNNTKVQVEKEGIEKEIKQLEGKKDEIDNEITILNTKNKTIEDDLNTLNNNKTAIENEIISLKKNRGSTENEITTIGNNITTIENEIVTLKNNVTVIENEMIKLNGDESTIKTEMNNFETEKDSLIIEVNEIKSEISALEIEKKSIDPKKDGITREIKNIELEIKSLNNKLKDIQEKQQANQDNIDSVEKVMQTHKEIAERSDLFDTDKDLQEQKIKPNTSANTSIVAEFVRDINNKPDPLEFEIYDGENKKVTGNKIKNIKLKNGTTVNIEGITINNNGEIAWDNAKAIDVATDKAIDDFPIEFELEIGAKTVFKGSLQNNTPDRNITITNKKMLQIKIDVDHLDQDKRKNEVNAYNNSGTGGRIEKSLDANHNVLIARLEREAFYRGLEKADGPKFNKLNAEQKELLYQDVRNTYRTAAGNPRTGAQFGRAANLANMSNFNIGDISFLEWITGEKHESNKPEFTKHGEAYRAYIHNNLEDQIKKYFERRFDQVFSNNQDGNTYIKGELTDFLTDIEKQKLDNDEVHQDVLGDIDAVDEMENTRRFGRLGRKDVNYLRFFAGQDSKVDIKDQTVNITTNNKPEDLNNPEPVKYDMSMEVSGKQQILANIKIGKDKEIKLKAGDPASMVRKILQCEDIQHGKVRAHVVYNLIKGFIDTAKKKDISLTYRDPGTGDMMVIKMDGKNIVLEQQDDHTNAGGTHRRNTTVLFDHQYFESTNTFDSTRGDENRRLRVGIDKMMGHFNFAMNELHYQYRQASERRWMGLRRGETRMTLPTSFWLSPIKKIINLNTTTKFDFSTNAQANGKSVNIEFKNNKFTLNMAGLKKPISSRTLGKLLRHRQGGVRIFDGMEREICGKIYEELIKKMRENSKVARTSFGVKDCITGRTYILDADGKLGYINAEQAANDPEMIRKGRLSKREYGIVDNPPEVRRMCDESETREVFKNPFLMGRLIKTMNNRMGIISSTRALL